MRSKIALIVGALLMVPMGAAWSGDDPNDPSALEHEGPGTPGLESFGNIQHVAQIGGFNASDLEFASREVVKLADGATGDPVCVVDTTQVDGCARDAEGNIVNQTEVRDFAVAGGYGPATRVIDITDPRNPVLVKIGPCSASQGDIQIQGDLLYIAQDGGNGSCARPGTTNATFNGSAILDFSNPRDPKYINRLQYTRGSHNQTAHPTKPFVFLSDSDLNNAGLGNIPVWNVSDPSTPVLATEFKFGAHSPHDITFNADGSRAYAAAVSLTYIINTENPAAPELVSVIPNEGITISHQADPTPDGDYLLVTDEVGGGAAGASPGGPVYLYDIREETRPVRVGAIWDDCIGSSKVVCDSDPPSNAGTISTAHVLRINPDGYTMAIGWYHDGIHVIDFSGMQTAYALAGSGDAANLGGRTIARMKMPNANNWSAKMWQERHPGYVFSTDHGGRGFDVFFVPELGETAKGTFVAAGKVAASHPATVEGVGATRLDWETNCEFSPRLNGVDGWVTKIPSQFADGTHELTVTDANGALEYDVDVIFYDASCGVVGQSLEVATEEIADIPEDAKYALATNWIAVPQATSLYFYAKQKTS